MGFFKSVAKAVSAPVTVPLKVTSNVIREAGQAFGVENVTSPLSTLAAAPYSAVVKGEGISGVLPSVASSVRELAPYVQAAGGIPGLNLAGTLPNSSLLTGLMGSSPGQLSQSPAKVDEVGASPAPMLVGSDYTMPIVIGAGALLLVLILRKK